MKVTFIALIITLFTIHTFAQEMLLLKQTKLSAAIAAEKANDPLAPFLTETVTLSNTYYPLIGIHPVTLPIIVQRSATGHLPLYAEYYYTPSDSIIRAVIYDWERDEYGNYFDKLKIFKEESTKLNYYSDEFSRIQANLAMQLGAPATFDIGPKEQNDGQKYYTRDAKWETDTYVASLNMIFYAGSTYRIRFFMYWKN